MVKKLTEALSEIKYFLLDMDGTIYIDSEPIGDMKNTLSYIRAKGKKIIFLTNNSSKNEEVYIEKLKRIGLFGEGDCVYTSGMAAIEFLKSQFKDKTVYLLGTEGLKKEFTDNGIQLIEDGIPDIAMLAYDTELTYAKLCKFTTAVKKGARYFATHPDVNCPAKDCFLPDVGSYIQLIKASTGREPEIIIGKPYTGMGDSLIRKYGAERNNFIMVGDRLYTDIRFGNNSGFYSMLVMSGETTEEDLKKFPDEPSFKLDSLNDIVKYF